MEGQEVKVLAHPARTWKQRLNIGVLMDINCSKRAEEALQITGFTPM